MGDVKASQIADFLSRELIGKDISIYKASALNALEPHSIVFSKSKSFTVKEPCLVLVPFDFKNKESIFSYIKVENPRLAFAKVVQNFFVDKAIYDIDSTSTIGDYCHISEEVKISKYCIIGNNVSIGRGTVINNHVVIGDNTIIGEHSYIKSGSVIGEDGFGFDFEDNGRPIRIPHLGKVVLGNNVEIGANNTIARATLGTTLLEDYVKTDDQVHIAHNCHIGENTLITACAEVSGSVYIGKNCWIAPNVSIIQKVKIGNNVTIGLGAVVTKEIGDNKKIMGLESLDLKSLIRLKKRVKYGE